MNKFDVEIDYYFPLMHRLAQYASESRDLDLIMILIENYKILIDQQRFSPNTLRAYRKAIKDFLSYTNSQQHLHHTSAADIGQFVAFLESPRPNQQSHGGRGRPPSKKPLARSSVIQRISAIRFLFAIFVWAGLCKINPADSIQRARSEAVSRQTLSYYLDIEILDLLAVANTHDKCLILLGAHGGLRANELNSLRWESVLFADQVIHVEGTESEVIHLSNRLTINLAAFKQEFDPVETLPEFVLGLRTQTGLYKRMENLCRAAAVKFKGVHALRNSCGRKLLALSGDARAVQQHLRLRSIEQVQRFATDEVPLATTIAEIDL